MVHTYKKYKYTNGEFVENVNGFILGFNFTYTDGTLRRCLYIESTDDLIAETTTAKCRYEMFETESETWILLSTYTALAIMSNYVNSSGVPQLEPYEEDGVTLKAGMIPEFKFFYDFQMQVYEGVLQSIQVRKYGATGFN